MSRFTRGLPTTRRRVLHLLGLLGIGSVAGARNLSPAQAQSTVGAKDLSPLPDELTPDAWPTMAYRTLGRTGFRGSRLVFGCGAALMFWSKDDLLQAAFDHGVNVFDVGTSDYYRSAEAHLAPFAKRNRDKIFLISKGLIGTDTAPGQELTVDQHKTAARNWSKALDGSLMQLAADHLDAYYMMATNNVSVVRSEELHKAFLDAKQAGKVDHWGVSSHENTQAVLEAAADTGWYSLAQVAMTPAGWYDWKGKAVLAGSPPMAALRPVLDKARAAGIGLIGMKAARHLTGSLWGFGPDRPTAFDAQYDAQFLKAPLSPFQRSYAYVLGHGLDAVNADSQSMQHLRENCIAAATSERYFA